MRKKSEEVLIHALKSPLTNIMINLDLALNNNRNKKQFLSSALNSVKNISTLLREKIHLDLNVKVCKQSLFSLNKILKGIQLTYHTPNRHYLIVNLNKNNDISFFGHLLSFQEALRCLVNNSLESYPDYLSYKVVQIISYKTKNYVNVLIVDNGRGIPFWQKLFIKYKGVSFKKGGSGCGLWMASQILEKQYGAKFFFEKNDGGGTTTTIKFRNS